MVQVAPILISVTNIVWKVTFSLRSAIVHISKIFFRVAVGKIYVARQDFQVKLK